jgi:predicted regulator of Ras-like GTPase activity (Roadblock/LC7/MglB family)
VIDALQAILGAAVREVPGALGGSFAAADGEIVAMQGGDGDEVAFTTAHHAVLLAQVRSALRTFHFGDPLELLVVCERGMILMQAVEAGYFAMLALGPDAPLADAQRALARASAELREAVA